MRLAELGDPAVLDGADPVRVVATLAYQFADTYDHRPLFPVAVLTGFLVLTGAYFVLNHVFYAQGVVSIIIELVGGSVFLYVILRKGRL